MDVPLSPTMSVALATWQQDFVSTFVAQRARRSLLVAAAGTGKTHTAMFAANKMLELGAIDSILVISDRVALRDQWREVATRYGVELERSLENQLARQGVSTTLQTLRATADDVLNDAAKGRRWLVIGDEPAYDSKSLAALIDRMLDANEHSKALFIARRVPNDLSFDAEFRFDVELIFDRRILQAPATQIHVARFSPSFSLLRELQKGDTAIDGMSWRQFEKLIATLLEREGYTVELMRGSKDGGVDVVAVMDLGPSGSFKTLWQAKKQNIRNKVGLAVVRELADTRQEFHASKGIIVTSSYLTRGALDRVERDKYILGKVDRKDLDAWIKRTLFGEKDS